MASLVQDLGIVEVILGDITAVAAGQTTSYSRTIQGITYSGSVVILPNGPSGTAYTVFTGSFWQILGLVLADAAGFQAGAPVQIAEKVGNTWFGISLSGTAAAQTA